MDDSTRTPHTGPESQADDESTGIGWSAPQQGTRPAPDAPWRRTSHDTGTVPRPNDTQQIPNPGSVHNTQDPPSGSGQWQTPYSAGNVPPYGGAAPEYGPKPPPPRGKRGTALITALVLGAGLVGGAAGAGIVTAFDDDGRPAPTSSLDNEARDAADLPESDIETVAQNVSPSVVSINIESAQGPGSGSGVVISSDGQILTNAHVAAAAGENGSLTVTFNDGSKAQAEVVGVDEQTDIAVIQAEGVSDLQAAEFGDSDNLAVGSEVIAFGSPLGLEGTVTQGIVSALHRPVQAGDARQQDDPTLFEAIQTDASINPGNSGGPLVNAAGQVVGINTAIAAPPGSQGSIGLGFAIPINTARYIAEQIVEGGEIEYARIGIGVDNGGAGEPAATVAEVQGGSAADEAGLEEGDTITHIDGRPVSDATALVAAARAYEPGDEITLTLVRDGEEQTVDLTLGSSADDE